MKFNTTRFDEDVENLGNMHKQKQGKPYHSNQINQNNAITHAELLEMSKSLSRQPVDNKVVFGFVKKSSDGQTLYCKFNKANSCYVIYSPNQNADSCLKKYCISDYRTYCSDKSMEYYDEIP